MDGILVNVAEGAAADNIVREGHHRDLTPQHKAERIEHIRLL